MRPYQYTKTYKVHYIRCLAKYDLCNIISFVTMCINAKIEYYKRIKTHEVIMNEHFYCFIFLMDKKLKTQVSRDIKKQQTKYKFCLI